MKKVTKKIVVLMLCVVTAFGTIACTGNNKKDNEVSIAYFDNITHGQALVMKHNKSLEKLLGNDKKVNWVAFNAGPAEVEACFSGDIDIGYIGPVPAATANIKSQGDFVIISGASNGGAMLIARKEANIKSVKDLSGKKVSVPQLGNTQHLLLLDLMKKNSLSTVSEGGDVDVIEAQNADVANLINSGDVDAALVPEPWGTTILKNAEAEIVLDYDEIQDGKDYSTAVIIVNKEYMEEHEDVVKQFLKAHMEATEYILDNPEDAGKIMNSQLDKDTGKTLDSDIIEQAIKRIDYKYEIPSESIINYSELCVEQGFINKKLTESAMDSKLLDEMKK